MMQLQSKETGYKTILNTVPSKGEDHGHGKQINSFSKQSGVKVY